MIRLLTKPAALAALALGLPAAAVEIRELDVPSYPITVSKAHADIGSVAVPAKPVTTMSPPPFLTSQSALIRPDGSLVQRCDGGSRHDFRVVKRSSDERMEMQR